MATFAFWTHFLTFYGVVAICFSFEGRKRASPSSECECLIYGSPGHCLPLGKCPALETLVLSVNSEELLISLEPYSIACDAIGRGYCCPRNPIATKPQITTTSFKTTTVPSLQPVEEGIKTLQNVLARNMTDMMSATTPFPFAYDEPEYKSSREPITTSSVILTNNEQLDQRRNLLPDSTCGKGIPKDRIKGGEDVAPGQYPWMVLLIMQLNGIDLATCGGVLITPQYVLSAAHCVVSTLFPPKSPMNISALLGKRHLRADGECLSPGKCEDGQWIGAESWKIHEGYDYTKGQTYNDIVLIRLAWKAEINVFVAPICLPRDDALTETFHEQRLNSAGWGQTEVENTSSILKEVELPVVSMEDCAPLYESVISLRDTQMCAGGEKGKDTCSGDSGSPLMAFYPLKSGIRWVLAGIVSFGPTPCAEAFPGVYTRVSKYVSWILDNIHE